MTRKRSKKNQQPQDNTSDQQQQPREDTRDPQQQPQQGRRDPQQQPREGTRDPQQQPTTSGQPKQQPQQGRRVPWQQPREDTRDPQQQPREGRRNPQQQPREGTRDPQQQPTTSGQPKQQPQQGRRVPWQQPREDTRDPQQQPREGRRDPQQQPREGTRDPQQQPITSGQPKQQPQQGRGVPWQQPREDTRNPQQQPREGRRDPQQQPQKDTRDPQQQPREGTRDPQQQPQQGRRDPQQQPREGTRDPQQQRQQGTRDPQQQPTTSEQPEQQASVSQEPCEPDKSVVNPLQKVVKVGGKSILPYGLQQSYMEQIPRRRNRDGGTDGRRIFVDTNMFKIVFSPNFQTNVVHYDVVITPDKPKFLLRPVFEAYRKKHFPKRFPAFDGRKNAYSAGTLPFGDTSIEDEVKVFDIERQTERSFQIYLTVAAHVDLSWMQSTDHKTLEYSKEQKGLQALDIILRHEASSRFIPVGRSLFAQPEPGRVMSLSGGLDLWVGTFQSAVIGWRPYLNMDVAHKGFPTPQSVIGLMRNLCQGPRGAQGSETVTASDVQRNHPKITKFLKGLKIQYEIPGESASKRTYRVNGLVECPRKNIFSLRSGTKCSVEQYFLETKKYRVKFPELPCLWVGSRNSTIHLPAELCTIVAGQVRNDKLDPVQTTNMIRAAATDTRTRKERILKNFANINLNKQPTLMNEFHLSVQGEMERVPARVLRAPELQYGQRKVNVSKGVWRAEGFLVASKLQEGTWTILNLDNYVRDHDLYENLHNRLQCCAQLVNMAIGRAQTPFAKLNIDSRNITRILEYFKEKKEQGIKLVVVVIPNIDDAYCQVKQICELKVVGGIVSQCIKSQTLRKMTDATVTNILLKINSKLNGVNHALAQRPLCLQKPCMLVGADVTHPSPDATDIPSIAAVAASHDPNGFQYNIEIRLQSPREEMIVDLEAIMRKQLIFFFKQTGHKPHTIIFYRDGVSDGQLPHVMHYELSAMRKAIASLEKSNTHKIAITFLVVQKRHHIRLFPTDARNSDDRNLNVQAGTIVDTNITHPTHVDFYLVSHASIQGTARPTKYRCICNENNLSDDEIEQLTYYLCHLFARCTRSVSYPAPTYYAHLAAFRARALIHKVPLNINNLPEAQRINMNLQINTNSPMFFV